MGLSRNKVAVPEGAAGTPPFWRILKGVPVAARRKPSKTVNTSFLERTLIIITKVVLNGRFGYPLLLVLKLLFYPRLDEAGRAVACADSLKPVL